jgi:hypothetical protein
MLTTTALFGTGGTPAAITDGGGGAAMRRASNRSGTSSGRSAGRSAPNTNGALRADAATLRLGSHVFGGRAVVATPKHREEGRPMCSLLTALAVLGSDVHF